MSTDFSMHSVQLYNEGIPVTDVMLPSVDDEY